LFSAGAITPQEMRQALDAMQTDARRLTAARVDFDRAEGTAIAARERLARVRAKQP
jgi:hypothetical protein